MISGITTLYLAAEKTKEKERNRNSNPNSNSPQYRAIYFEIYSLRIKRKKIRTPYTQKHAE